MPLRAATPQTATTLGLHDVVDLDLGKHPSEGNPFDVEFRATLTGPDGALITVPGFYDAERGFLVRVSLPTLGQWRAVTASNVDGLNGLSFDLVAVDSDNPREHGPLLVDSVHPRHFVHADGNRFFLRGYEVDWLLMIDQHDGELSRVRSFVESIEAAGFTMVTVNAYAHSFRQWVPEDLEKDGRWVVPTIAPWPGGNASPDYSRLDPDFFEHMDKVIAHLQSRGIATHLMFHVYNKDVNWPELGSADDDRYWKYLLARYQAFSTIIWDTAKESYYQPPEYIWTRIALIRQQDAYRRLLTVHDANLPAYVDRRRQYGDANKELIDMLTDFTADQILQDIYPDALEHHLRYTKPYVNIEFGYESGIDDLPSDHPDHDQHWREVTRRMWHIVMGGGYPNYYYRNTAWSLFVPFPEPPGYATVRVLADFWDSVGYWSLTPGDSLVGAVEEVFCRAQPGTEYVVYTDHGTPFDLAISHATEPLLGVWLDPLRGARADAGVFADGTHHFASPWGNQTPAVLHLARRR